jgi:hypothetical protein
MNCEFEACGVTQDIVIPMVPEDAEEVILRCWPRATALIP